MVNTAKFIDQAITEIREAAAGRGVVMALSGGVDSRWRQRWQRRQSGVNLCRFMSIPAS